MIAPDGLSDIHIEGGRDLVLRREGRFKERVSSTHILQPCQSRNNDRIVTRGKGRMIQISFYQIL